VQRALEGLRGVQAARVDLDTGEVLVATETDADTGDMAQAVEGLVILAWARGLLARIPFLGRRQP